MPPQDPWVTPTPHNTTLLVLCGGKGARMGGVDKPLLYWREHTMLEHVLASVPEEMPKLISANRNISTYAQRAPVVEDHQLLKRYSMQPGPLVGVLAGLQAMADHSSQRWLLVSPGDTPGLPADWYPTMQQSAKHTRAYALVAHDGERQQHLHLLLHRSVTANLLAYLTGGGVAVFAWLAEIQAAQAAFAAPGAFRNINRPEDLTD